MRVYIYIYMYIVLCFSVCVLMLRKREQNMSNILLNNAISGSFIHFIHCKPGSKKLNKRHKLVDVY